MRPALQNRDLTELAAFVILGAKTLEDAASEARLTPEQLLDYMEAASLDIDETAARMKSTGRFAEAKAAGLLLRILDRFESQIDELTPATATRVAEILLRVSGLAEKRAADLKRPDQPRSTFSLNIVLHDRVINIGGNDNAIDGEACEVVGD